MSLPLKTDNAAVAWLRPDGGLLVHNSMGDEHRLSMAHVPVTMVYRDGRYLPKLPQKPLATEFIGRCFELFIAPVRMQVQWCK